MSALPSPRTGRVAMAVLSAGVLVALAGCGGSSDDNAAAPGGSKTGAIGVKAGDSSCEVDRTTLDAGTHTFQVTNSGSQVTEFYVYAAGDRIMGEVENVGPALTRQLIVELPAGQYQTACKPGQVGQGIRGNLVVSGAAPQLSEDALLAQAVIQYQKYVETQSAALLERTKEFVAAIKAGDSAKAMAMFPEARVYYERIEPIAESFGDLDPLIDQRIDDVEAGKPFTGFHRLEKDLYQDKNITKSGPIADQLLKDVTDLVTRVPGLKLSPLDLANGAKALLDEVATRKVTGEEDRYSHTDLWDFNANVEGAKAAISALRPALDKNEPALGPKLDTRFGDVEKELATLVEGNGFTLYTALSKAQVKTLSDKVNALSEPLSKVAAAISGK
jgi:iron uptake system component EfeO